MNKNFLKGLGVAVLASALAVPAFAAGPDFTTLTAAADFTSTVTAVMAIAGAGMTLVLVTVGIRHVYRAIKGL